ncbi:Flagellar hook-length control protein [Legionella massiliensis]|uniref:Flagellar hook-length control protein n=1 Tax=Legionella massiliensis TaxID=1034943 RepID=A0A078L1L2_9GAMM|nr:flagellar hook-length control protein FliK [Legionella massiliensis]CDZ79106.1 Flagellar hook-length control protein [Legionella massiliensis]CEE14844.1 Flagellar hook-length control protein [Legionella massiliensis]
MMDLIQLLAPQQAATAIDSTNDVQTIEGAVAQEDIASFTDLISDLLSEEQPTLSVADNPVVDKQLSKINSQQLAETTEIESRTENDSVPEPLDSMASQQVQKTVVNAIDNNEHDYRTPLVWFDSESFVPPTRSREIVEIEPEEDFASLQPRSEALRQEEQQEEVDNTELVDNELSEESIPQPLAQFIPAISQDLAQSEYSIALEQQETQLNSKPSIQTKEVPERASVLETNIDKNLSHPERIEGALETKEMSHNLRHDLSPREDLNVVENEAALEISSYLEPELAPELVNIERAEALDESSSLDSTIKNLPFAELNQRQHVVKETETNNIALKTNITSSDWSEQFNQQIIWLGQQKIKTAIIKLNPEDLGPIEVKIDLVKDETKLNIRTDTPEVGNLIEQAIPRLREMMTLQGLNLLEVNIESNANQRHSSQQEYTPRSIKESEGDNPSPVEERTKISTGLIDYFA